MENEENKKVQEDQSKMDDGNGNGHTHIGGGVGR